MLKKIVYSLLFSSVALMALETGESVPQNIQEKLKLESDKVYVVDFFASWCKSCKKELPLIMSVYNEKTVEVIGVNVDKNQKDGQKFVGTWKNDLPHGQGISSLPDGLKQEGMWHEGKFVDVDESKNN